MTTPHAPSDRTVITSYSIHYTKLYEQRELEHVFGNPQTLAGSGNDLFALAESAHAGGRELPRLYQWCGTEDFLYLDNRRFRKHLELLDVAVDYDEGPGGHEWSCWDAQIQKVLAWVSDTGGERIS